MTILTFNQVNQLHSNGVYTTLPENPICSMDELLQEHKTEAVLQTIQRVSGSPNGTVAASFFMRRYGMFTAMQLTQYIMYEDWWQGELNALQFGAVYEYGNLTVSAFPEKAMWKEHSREQAAVLARELVLQIHAVTKVLRTASAVSPNVLWENVFGFWLWQFHVLLNDPIFSEEARHVFNLLKEDVCWEGISSHSKFASYLQGSEPTDLLNVRVRKTCCLSKDVPGLMQCGFCPLKP